MKNRIKNMKILLVLVAICFPLFSYASNGTWADRACSNTSCDLASNNFTEPYCVGDGDVSANICIFPNLTNALSDFGSIKNTKDAIKTYCTTLFSETKGRIYFSKPGNGSDSWDWQQTFDSHQSLFLDALCGSFKGSGFVVGSTLSGVYKGDVVKILNLQQRTFQNSVSKDLCLLSDDPSLYKCDISIYATKIFDGIMSDLFRIKYAQVLHLDTAEKFNVKRKVENFMDGYYGIDSKYNDIKKKYSKTVSVLESDLKRYKDVLDKIKLIDNSKLAKLAENSGCPTDQDMVGMDFIACALYSSQGKGGAITPSFLTMLYNELLNYQEFMMYYTTWLSNRASANNTDDDNDTKLVYDAMLNDFKGYFSIQKEALELAEHNLEDFSMTYPLHIRLLLYVEKVEKFRAKYSEIITMFYSLSEKLQNVQIQ